MWFFLDTGFFFEFVIGESELWWYELEFHDQALNENWIEHGVLVCWLSAALKTKAGFMWKKL